uniref:Secreted protein n=1 Tax=Romanomermis culicivorax TaxID=13658 RepID=A0A915IGZ3_ROMCU
MLLISLTLSYTGDASKFLGVYRTPMVARCIDHCRSTSKASESRSSTNYYDRRFLLTKIPSKCQPCLNEIA